ncbi:MAG: hypothetical protein ABR964_05815 [Tepidisphaeraceae bacterium]|jgi:hypothetical protein
MKSRCLLILLMMWTAAPAARGDAADSSQPSGPPAAEAADRAMSTLLQLQNEKNLSPSQRQELLEQSAGDLIRGLQVFNDPQVLFRQGQILAAQGVDPQSSILEYWGATDTAKAHLRPLADAAWRVFDQANRLATAQATDLANRITSPEDALGDAWRKTNDLAGIAAYQKARMQYALALSLDAADARRPKLIAEALAAFAQWDNADSGIAPQVRLLMAKLHAIWGSREETTVARRLIASLTHDAQHQISPEPSASLLFEARCELVIVNLDSGDAAGAAAALGDATADQQANFPDDPDQAATLRLLQYRLLALRADQAAPGAAKKAANAAAVGALAGLIRDFPSLRAVIYQQLAARIGADAEPGKLDALSLAALVDQGRQQVLAAGAQQVPEPGKLKTALAAAQEILARYSAGSIPADQAVEPSLLVGIFQEFLGDKLAAVDSLLDHIERFGDTPAAKADFALDRAQGLIAELRQSSPVDPHGRWEERIERLQDRFLPIAVNPPFNRKQFALQYAASLLAQGKWDQAVACYRMVPDSDEPAQVLAARYGEMVALKDQLDEDSKLTPGQRLQRVDQIEQLGQTVDRLAQQLIDSSNSPTQKDRARSTLARTSLLAADVTRREGNDPQRVLQLLDGFEDSVRGLSDAQVLLNGALFLRVQSYMQLGQIDDATRTLVQFLNATGGGEGAQTVHDLLAVLNKELLKAQDDAEAAAHNPAAAKAAQQHITQLANNRAMLSGFLVQWAQESSDPKIRAYTYTYRRFDAEAKLAASKLQSDPQLRQRELAAVMQMYRELQSPQNVALYRAGIDPASGIDKNQPDPLVTLGIGLTAYELGDCKTVLATLGPLVQDRKLGEDNAQYWEATYKLLDCMHKLAQAGDPSVSEANVARSLKVLYLIWRDGTGGPKWHEQFDQLRKAVIPDWTVPSATHPSPP